MGARITRVPRRPDWFTAAFERVEGAFAEDHRTERHVSECVNADQ